MLFRSRAIQSPLPRGWTLYRLAGGCAPDAKWPRHGCPDLPWRRRSHRDWPRWRLRRPTAKRLPNATNDVRGHRSPPVRTLAGIGAHCSKPFWRADPNAIASHRRVRIVTSHGIADATDPPFSADAMGGVTVANLRRCDANTYRSGLGNPAVGVRYWRRRLTECHD